MEIVPAVLATTEKEFVRQIEIASSLSSIIQIDIVDGIYVPNTTFGPEYIVKYFKKNKLNFRKNTFDFHLMVQNWAEAQEIILHADISIRYILVHYTVWASNKKPETFHVLVFNPQESIDTHCAKQFSAVQIMTIEPGKQGNVFLPETLEKITQLREHGYEGKILVDGGINDSTLPYVLSQRYLPDIVAVGSYLTTAINPKEKYDILQTISRS